MLSLASVALFSQLSLQQPEEVDREPKDCSFEKVDFTTNFAVGRLHHCEKTGDNQYSLYLEPEREKINPSPWYAFAVENLTEESQTIDITLVASEGVSRYKPKRSAGDDMWHPIPFSEGDGWLQFELTLSAQTKELIAGQEIIDNVHYIEWLSSLIKEPQQSEVISLGVSSEGRNLAALEHKVKSSDKWIILIGRQHPPEVTGALALLHFGELLFSDEAYVVKFRQKYNILLVPNMNPDGVYHGNWRLTAAGIDMNRDWNNQTLPETQALTNYLEKLVEDGGQIEFAIDFHSTHRNVFYTMPKDYESPSGVPLRNPQRVYDWIEEIAEMVDSVELEYQPGDHPESGVFKQFIADEFAAHAVTYEVSDSEDRNNIKRVAEAALISLVNRLD
ncbi:M14 family metallopeptidase [Idiomarina abyssalis]|uniref:M14 family metallopeptidase n=1 Tax=Idiomarina abyssalis TaxID=86102 RepID=UPI0006C85F9D|nr:M14 family metallopeptidase [Idiomarina abyssalis]KPD22521.1 carboxypeptidase [Idiomarina abyssalis]SFT42424.1 Zinc carboxypeptidase [Idiomarina abyssalis]